MRIAYHVMTSPVGLLFLARTAQGLRHVDFMDRKSIKRMIANHAAAYPDATWEPSLLKLKSAVDQLEGYFCGGLKRFDLELDPEGTPFQRQAWAALMRIPFAKTSTYGEIARAIKQPKSARAIGLANNQNPLAIIIPCHRVIGANGAITGYSGGIPRKRWLLQHEARFSDVAGGEVDLYTAASGRSAGRRDPR